MTHTRLHLALIRLQVVSSLPGETSACGPKAAVPECLLSHRYWGLSGGERQRVSCFHEYAGLVQENPGMTGLLMQRQLISVPGKMCLFTAGSNQPFDTS